MKPADLGDRYDVAFTGHGDPAGDRRVLVQRQVRTRLFVVRTIPHHQPLQARFVEHDHVIEAFTTSGSNTSLDECILPRRARCREHVLDRHRLRRAPEAVKGVIAIVNQVSRRLVSRKRLPQLLGRPRRRRMRGDGEVPNATPIVGEEYRDEHEAVGHRRDYEEIGRHNLAEVIP